MKGKDIVGIYEVDLNVLDGDNFNGILKLEIK